MDTLRQISNYLFANLTFVPIMGPVSSYKKHLRQPGEFAWMARKIENVPDKNLSHLPDGDALRPETGVMQHGAGALDASSDHCDLRPWKSARNLIPRRQCLGTSATSSPRHLSVDPAQLNFWGLPPRRAGQRPPWGNQGLQKLDLCVSGGAGGAVRGAEYARFQGGLP